MSQNKTQFCASSLGSKWQESLLLSDLALLWVDQKPSHLPHGTTGVGPWCLVISLSWAITLSPARLVPGWASCLLLIPWGRSLHFSPAEGIDPCPVSLWMKLGERQPRSLAMSQMRPRPGMDVMLPANKCPGTRTLDSTSFLILLIVGTHYETNSKAKWNLVKKLKCPWRLIWWG